MLAEANEEANRTRQKGLADVEAAKSAAVRELAEASVDSAVSLASNIVGRSLKKDDHAKLIEESVKRFAGSQA
jgi:F0F1-type ATP synthase membrane subunit b/b'